jgi:hypothetical protein
VAANSHLGPTIVNDCISGDMTPLMSKFFVVDGRVVWKSKISNPTTKMHANSHVQFDTCTVSYTCQTVRHVQIDTRITRVKRACDELHNLTRVLKYTCQV